MKDVIIINTKKIGADSRRKNHQSQRKKNKKGCKTNFSKINCTLKLIDGETVKENLNR